MIIRILQIVFILGIFTSKANSQWRIVLEPELGINSSGIPFRDKYSTGNDDIKEQELPLLRPLVGASISSIKGNLILKLGLQYSQCGYNNSFERSSDVNQVQIYYHSTETLLLNRLVIPFIVGYRIPIKKVNIVVFGGYKRIYFLSGNYTYYSEYNDSIVESKEIDPFDYSTLDPGAKKISWQYLAGLEVELFKSLFVAIGFSHGGKIYFSESQPPGVTDPSSYHEYSNGDLSLSLKYQIQLSKEAP